VCARVCVCLCNTPERELEAELHKQEEVCLTNAAIYNSLYLLPEIDLFVAVM